MLETLNKWPLFAVAGLAGCTAGPVPGLSDRDVVFQNPLCLIICTTILTVADTDTGAGSSSVAQTSSNTTAPTAAGSYSK